MRVGCVQGWCCAEFACLPKGERHNRGQLATAKGTNTCWHDVRQKSTVEQYTERDRTEGRKTTQNDVSLVMGLRLVTRCLAGSACPSRQSLGTSECFSLELPSLSWGTKSTLAACPVSVECFRETPKSGLSAITDVVRLRKQHQTIGCLTTSIAYVVARPSEPFPLAGLLPQSDVQYLPKVWSIRLLSPIFPAFLEWLELMVHRFGKYLQAGGFK